MAKHTKPAKPRPDFPLYPHANGRWAKRIRWRIHYFSKWDDPDGAEQKYLDEREYLKAGRKPPTNREGLLDANGEPHIMDFGLARRETGEVTMTAESRVLGTPAYMSPEQAKGSAHTADRRTNGDSLPHVRGADPPDATKSRSILTVRSRLRTR